MSRALPVAGTATDASVVGGAVWFSSWFGGAANSLFGGPCVASARCSCPPNRMSRLPPAVLAPLWTPRGFAGLRRPRVGSCIRLAWRAPTGTEA
eukprot:6995233-Alexandrium_andersonii.AAC.1